MGVPRPRRFTRRFRTGGQDRMNDRMRKTAWERITDPKARKTYDALCGG